jgi:hypothetical protein
MVAVQVERDLPRQALDDGAIGATIALAGGCKVFQRVSHLVEFPRALLECTDVLEGDASPPRYCVGGRSTAAGAHGFDQSRNPGPGRGE